MNPKTRDVIIPLFAQQDAQEILKDGVYAMPFKTPPKSVLDIGGNIGLFSLWARKQFPKARIVAFEPWVPNADLFVQNTKGLRIKLHRAAVAEKYGKAEMRQGRNPMCCSINETVGNPRTVKTVAASGVGDFDFVKIDCEGTELSILKTINLQNTKAVALEVHNLKELDEIRDILKAAGFIPVEDIDNGNDCWLLKYMKPDAIAPKPLKVFFGMPIDEGAMPEFWHCVFQLQNSKVVPLVTKTTVGDSLISRARNTLTAEFLKTDCTHLLWADSDMVFSPEHVKRLVDHDLPLVAGFYPKKADGKLEWVCNRLDDEKPNANGLCKMRYMGTGFMLIKREVFESMIKAFGYSIAFNPDRGGDELEYDLWPVGVHHFPDGTSRYLSEDWFFCQRWLDLGGTVWGDTNVILKHLGRATFPLESQIPDIIK